MDNLDLIAITIIAVIILSITIVVVYKTNKAEHMVANKLDPAAPLWLAPNMVNYKGAIRQIQNKERRRPQYMPNEERFENYRPGDWNINGYTAMKMMNNKEGFSDIPNAPTFLRTVRGLENEPTRRPTRLANISYEGFKPGFAAGTARALNKLMNEEDQNYYLGEQWFPPDYYTNPLYMQQWANKFKKK